MEEVLFQRDPEEPKVKKSRVKIIKKIHFNFKNFFVVVVFLFIILSWSFYWTTGIITWEKCMQARRSLSHSLELWPGTARSLSFRWAGEDLVLGQCLAGGGELGHHLWLSGIGIKPTLVFYWHFTKELLAISIGVWKCKQNILGKYINFSAVLWLTALTATVNSVFTELNIQ